MLFEAPIRCVDCGILIEKKPKAKTPKYCTKHRLKRQDDFKEQLKQNRQRRSRGR